MAPLRSPSSLGSAGELLVTRREDDLRDEREVGDTAAARLVRPAGVLRRV